MRSEAELTSFQHKKSGIAVPEENLTPDEPYNISAFGQILVGCRSEVEWVRIFRRNAVCRHGMSALGDLENKLTPGEPSCIIFPYLGNLNHPEYFGLSLFRSGMGTDF